MTGPEHYREAERIAATITHRGALEPGEHAQVLALAQLHATLAVAAATAVGADPSIPPRDWAAWQAVACVKPEDGGGDDV